MIGNQIILAFIVASSLSGAAAEKWRATEIPAEASKITNTPILDTASMTVWELSGQSDSLSIDEKLDVFIIGAAGEAVFSIGNEELSLQADQAAAFKGVKKIVRFNASNDFSAIAIQPIKPYEIVDTAIDNAALTEVRQAVKTAENSWTPFIQRSSATLGLYALPKELGGDNTLTHQIDEINIVIKGEAKFHMDDDVIAIKPGSVIWVERGVGHSFSDLSEDFEVLILFAQNLN